MRGSSGEYAGGLFRPKFSRSSVPFSENGTRLRIAPFVRKLFSTNLTNRTMLEILLPYPPSANKLWTVGRSANGRGRTIASAEYSNWLRLVQVWAWRNGGFPRLDAPMYDVEIVFFPPRRGKIDVDNRNKAILDALTRLGVWKDDSLVVRLTTTRGLPAEEPFAVVRITPLDSFDVPTPKTFGGHERKYRK